MEALQQHALIELACAADGFLHVLGIAQVDGNAVTLLTVHGLDHQAAMSLQEGRVFLRRAGQLLCRQVQPGARQGTVSQLLVLAERHAHCRGEVGQRFPATHPAPALGQREKPGFGVVDIDLDAAPARFVDDDASIGVEFRLRRRAEEQRLVEAVLALDGEGRQVAEAELGVECLGLMIVVQHGQVEVGQPAAHVVFDQVAHQRFADARAGATGRYRQAPQAGAVLRVAEGLVMIDAHHAADHLAGVRVLGDPVHRAAFFPRRAALMIEGHHAARLVQAVDRLPVGLRLRPADGEAAEAPPRGAIVGEMQAQGVRRIEEQLLRSMCQDLVRGRDVERDVTLAGLLLEQLGGEFGGVGKGMPHQDAAPAAMQGDGCARLFLAVLGKSCLQALIGRRLSAQQSLSIGL